MNRRDIPNLITFLRLLLIVPIVWYFNLRAYGIVLILFVTAGASDALDGYLARRNQWTSHLGGWLDPLADKAMLVTVYILLVLSPKGLVTVMVRKPLVLVFVQVLVASWVASLVSTTRFGDCSSF